MALEGSEAKSGADREQTENRWEQEESKEEQKETEASRRGAGQSKERAKREQKGLAGRAKQWQPPSLRSRGFLKIGV
jgi:hypothetical protein